MKGFIHLIEVMVAILLVSVVLAGLFSVRIKENWERIDIIESGINMMNLITQNESYVIGILDEDILLLNEIRPANVKYGLDIVGSPKSLIIVGCDDAASCVFTNNILTPTYVNGRWIDFYIEYFNISEPISEVYDSIIIVNRSDYSINKQRINDYLDAGGVVIAINDSYNDVDFNEIFNLTPSAGAGDLNFTVYDLYDNKVLKYFLGFGFDASTSWFIWGDEWVIYYGAGYVNLTRVSDGQNLTLSEGNEFTLAGPGPGVYSFRLRKIWSNRIDIQPLDRNFMFENSGFSENNCRGNNIVANSINNIATMTKNNSAIWISYFPQGDEYRALVKSAIAAHTDEWRFKRIETTRELFELSSFVSLCCDMPEVVELVLSLSYIL
jgi:hypothetical protein